MAFHSRAEALRLWKAIEIVSSLIPQLAFGRATLRAMHSLVRVLTTTVRAVLHLGYAGCCIYAPSSYRTGNQGCDNRDSTEVRPATRDK